MCYCCFVANLLSLFTLYMKYIMDRISDKLKRNTKCHESLPEVSFQNYQKIPRVR